MGRGLSYADAVRLLGGQGSKVVAALDRLCGGLLLAVSASGGGFALSLLGARSELVRLSDDLLAGLGGRLSGLSRFSRSERLVAAHVVIVLTSYFDSLDRVGLPVTRRELALTKAEQAAFATRETEVLAAGLLRAEVPAPEPQWPFEVTLAALRRFYASVSNDLCRFVTGLAVWDRLDDTERDRVRHTLVALLPDHAVARYEESYRRLAADFPEFAVWANQVDHQATRARLESVNQGLAGLEQLLTRFAMGRAPTEHRAALARAYRVALKEPILPSGDGPSGLRIPHLGDAYVNPDFRVAQVDMSDRLADQVWWDRHQVRADLSGFLAGYFTAPQATTAPLVILGQPGSGKSVLTKVLAARLPPSEFLTVRIALRDVPADADVQTQIEHGLRAASGEDARWPQLARSAGDALPVVLLDGFDELLQATGVSQSDYLEKVADFQRRESDLGRPVAVVVTSRTVLVDRTRLVWGMVAIRLEPFRDAQVADWLRVWNSTNAGYFTARGLSPLPSGSVLMHTELAAQPLLLLMLAVYDADDNALQDGKTPLGHSELYERLLTRFAEREVRKSLAALTDEDFGRAVEWELTRLSVAAFAMFNRHRQWVTQAELDTDLGTLLGDPGEQRSQSGLRAALSAAQVVIGRFFFVHEARASRDGTHLKTYEFLHTTFGEYLLGRLVVRELVELVKPAELGFSRGRPSSADDSFLHAVLSYAALTVRGTAVSFVAEQLAALPEDRRNRIRGVLLELFQHALEPRHDTTYAAYQPVRLGVPARYAAYSANLLVLAVLVSGEVTARELFPRDHDDPVNPWRRITLLWRSQLSSEGWNRLIRTVAVHREWDGDRRTIRLNAVWDETGPAPVDPYWSYNRDPAESARAGHTRWRHYAYDELRAHSNFRCERHDDTVIHALEPFSGPLDPAIGTLVRLPDGDAMSPAHAIIALWLASGRHDHADALVTAYEACLHMAQHGFSGSATEARESYCELVLRQLAADRGRLPAEWTRAAVARIVEPDDNARLRALGQDVLG